MSTNELLAIVSDRGLKIVLKEGRPVLLGPVEKGKVTDELLKVLKMHRERIISIISSGGSYP